MANTPIVIATEEQLRQAVDSLEKEVQDDYRDIQKMAHEAEAAQIGQLQQFIKEYKGVLTKAENDLKSGLENITDRGIILLWNEYHIYKPNINEDIYDRMLWEAERAFNTAEQGSQENKWIDTFIGMICLQYELSLFQAICSDYSRMQSEGGRSSIKIKDKYNPDDPVSTLIQIGRSKLHMFSREIHHKLDEPLKILGGIIRSEIELDTLDQEKGYQDPRLKRNEHRHQIPKYAERYFYMAQHLNFATATLRMGECTDAIYALMEKNVTLGFLISVERHHHSFRYENNQVKLTPEGIRSLCDTAEESSYNIKPLFK